LFFASLFLNENSWRSATFVRVQLSLFGNYQAGRISGLFEFFGCPLIGVSKYIASFCLLASMAQDAYGWRGSRVL
jgi:hypothetical protein